MENDEFENNRKQMRYFFSIDSVYMTTEEKQKNREKMRPD